MTDFFLLNKIIIILIDSLGAWLALWVYSSNRKANINRWFMLLVIVALAWITLCYFSGTLTDNLELSLFLGRLAYGVAILFMIPFYFFSISFIEEEKKFSYLKIIIPIGSFMLAWFSIFTDWMAERMILVTFGRISIGVVPVLGQGKFFWFGFAFFVTIFIFFRFIKQYLKLTEAKKRRLQYFLLGLLVFVIATIVFNIILAFLTGDARYYQVGNYSIIFFIGFTAYAIIKRDLFGIKIVLTQTLVGIIAILLLVDVVASETLFEYIWKGILFALFVFLGWLLIRSVLKEIKYREKIKEAYEREVGYRKKIKEAYEIEKKAHKELQRLNEAKTQFIMATQHHLRTPLTSMIGYLDLIFGGIYGKVPQKLGETLKKFEVSTSRLIKVVNELLDISQFQLGKKIVILKDGIDIEPILREIMEELEAEAKTKKIYLELVKPKKALPLTKADPEKLKVAITNIIDNGVKYTSKGGVTISLKAQMIGAKAKLQIIIKDTGMGIAKEELKTLFSRTFERGEEAKQVYTTGRGIGLYITYQIIRAHNGKIWAESEGRNKGTSFYIELPAD